MGQGQVASKWVSATAQHASGLQGTTRKRRLAEEGAIEPGSILCGKLAHLPQSQARWLQRAVYLPSGQILAICVEEMGEINCCHVHQTVVPTEVAFGQGRACSQGDTRFGGHFSQQEPSLETRKLQLWEGDRPSYRNKATLILVASVRHFPTSYRRCALHRCEAALQPSQAKCRLVRSC
jgi:hypothetical protein